MSLMREEIEESNQVRAAMQEKLAQVERTLGELQLGQGTMLETMGRINAMMQQMMLLMSLK